MRAPGRMHPSAPRQPEDTQLFNFFSVLCGEARNNKSLNRLGAYETLHDITNMQQR